MNHAKNDMVQVAILNQLNAPLILDYVQVPDLKRGQVFVKVLCAGICRAQYNEIVGLKGPDKFLPHLLGHEASAVVQRIGAGVRKVKPGDYVVLSWIKGSGLDGLSTQYRWRGKIANAGGVTTFGTHAIVSENRVTKISRRVPADVAALLGCAIPTGAGIIDHSLNAKKGSSLVVFGSGGIGQSIILAARRKGCKTIAAVDIQNNKLLMAKKMGATNVVNMTAKDPRAQLQKICPQGFDYAVDASGSKEAMEMGFDALSLKGVLVVAGNVPKGQKVSFPPFDFIKGKKVIGTWGGETYPDKDVPRYAKEYLSGILPIQKLITHRFQLKDINKAINVLKEGQAGRIILEIGQENAQ